MASNWNFNFNTRNGRALGVLLLILVVLGAGYGIYSGIKNHKPAKVEVSISVSGSAGSVSHINKVQIKDGSDWVLLSPESSSDWGYYYEVSKKSTILVTLNAVEGQTYSVSYQDKTGGNIIPATAEAGSNGLSYKFTCKTLKLGIMISFVESIG